MDRRKLEKAILHFQAYGRRYLVRRQIQCARKDFEEIVLEIDGTLAHLKWDQSIIPKPHFTDYISSDLLYGFPSREICKISDPKPDINVPEKLPSISEKEDGCVQVERKEAERDDSHVCEHSSPAEEIKQIPVENPNGEVMESTGRSPTISLDLDTNNCSNKGDLEDVQQTPDALRLHRNTLTMELLWLQQAIDSRKKYLSLKNKLNES